MPVYRAVSRLNGGDARNLCSLPAAFCRLPGVGGKKEKAVGMGPGLLRSLCRTRSSLEIIAAVSAAMFNRSEITQRRTTLLGEVIL